MGILGIVTYWWPGILAVVLIVLAASGAGGPEIIVIAALLALQALVIGYRVIRFGVNEVRARSAQESFQE